MERSDMLGWHTEKGSALEGRGEMIPILPCFEGAPKLHA
jgi:hypothetical protein